jgi:excisionase family DNA binding protein
VADSWDEFLTVAEVASILKLNQQTVRNWIDTGKLPAVRIGPRRVRIRRSDFDRLISERYTGTPPSAKPPRPIETQPNIWDGEIPPPVVPG